MSEHSFYCPICRSIVRAEDLHLLAARVNHHNTLVHPFEFSSWDAVNLVGSNHYLPPPGRSALIAQSKTFQDRWGDAARAPIITADDLAMLKKANVKW